MKEYVSPVNMNIIMKGHVSPIKMNFNPLVAELFCHKLDLLEIVGFLCTFLQHVVC